MGTHIHSLQPPFQKQQQMQNQLMENASSEAQFSDLCAAVIRTSEESVKDTWSRVSVLHLLGCRAGSKSLYAVQGLVDIYIFSENTTFK